MAKNPRTEMPPGISRRAFLHKNAVLVGGTILAGPALASSVCRPTEHDVLGPFYIGPARRFAPASQAPMRPATG